MCTGGPEPGSSGNSRKSQKPSHKVYPASRAGLLDMPFRRLLYRPRSLAERYVKPGTRVIDFGCGPGFFTREFARVVGDAGLVVAADLQEEMLRILRGKMEADGLIFRVMTHRCSPESIGLPDEFIGTIDTAFALFVVHEVPDPARLFAEIASLLRPGGRFFYAEPFVVVNEREFRARLDEAGAAGLHLEGRRYYFLNRAAVFRKPSP